MARSDAIWGIDIGQCALKALRCRPHSEPDKVIVEAFDYVEYPKILSQPEADPPELIREALTLFLSRNNVRNDRVAISVAGQNGLARFIKLPPVESKKIPDIVKYEARQQIPFALEDVVWDYQQMAGGSVEEGFALETEVGLFAMKRDQVFRALKPLDDKRIEVDIVQLTPLALYNYITFDRLQDVPPPDEIDPENPPESILVLSLGTDTTDLVVTNGYRVWQRSVPIGGNHFTKALTKELKLTFAKAEHLKRNATKAEDPKAVFQAMRPVFNDLVTEIDRSIRFFTGIDRNAKIGRVVALGNAMKLPGLQKYLSQNLGYEVESVESFRGLTGAGPLNTAAFKDNVLAFGVCYGLCLQGLNRSKLSTNLVPSEIVKDRMIREKKPWAVAAVAALLVGCAVGFFGHWRAWASVQDKDFKVPLQTAADVAKQSSDLEHQYEEKNTEYARVQLIGERLVGINERRALWLELLKAIDDSAPHDTKPQADLAKRNEIHIDALDCEHLPDLKDWFAINKERWDEGHKGIGEPTTTPVPTPDAPVAPAGGAVPAAGAPNPGGPAPAGEAGPAGPGWVIEIHAHHYHNDERGHQTAQFVRDTLLKNLETGSVVLSDGQVSLKELGVGFPVLIYNPKLKEVPLSDPNLIVTPVAGDAGGRVAPASGGAATPVKDVPVVTAKRYDFIIQFCWQETPASKRLQKRLAAQAARDSQQPPPTDLPIAKP